MFEFFRNLKLLLLYLMIFVTVFLRLHLPLNTGFDNYHKIVVRDHVRMPKFRRSVRDVRWQIPKNIY